MYTAHSFTMQMNRDEQIRILSEINDQLVMMVLEQGRYIREMERMQKWNRLNIPKAETQSSSEEQ